MIGDKWSSPVSDMERIIESQAMRLKVMVGMALSLDECREFITETYDYGRHG